MGPFLGLEDGRYSGPSEQDDGVRAARGRVLRPVLRALRCTPRVHAYLRRGRVPGDVCGAREEILPELSIRYDRGACAQEELRAGSFSWRLSRDGGFIVGNS